MFWGRDISIRASLRRSLGGEGQFRQEDSETSLRSARGGGAHIWGGAIIWKNTVLSGLELSDIKVYELQIEPFSEPIHISEK